MNYKEEIEQKLEFLTNEQLKLIYKLIINLLKVG